MALSAMGDYRGAAECYRRSADAARAVDFAMVEAMALNNLGSLEYGLGDPGQAIEAFRRALDIMRRIDQKREAVTPELNIAVSLMDLGRLDDAGDVLARCVEECAANNYLDLQGIALYQEAELRRRRALAHEAAGLYRRALALGPAQTLRNRIECLVGLSDALAEIDSAGAAFDAARAAVDIVVREGAREMEPLARRTLARRWTAAGEHRKSLAELTAADRAAALSGWSDRRVGILADAAGNWRALGEPDRALALLDSAAAIWEEERRIPLDPEWRESRGASGKIIFTDLADLLLGPDPASASGERIAAAFNRLQRFKTRTLIERMLGPGGLDSCSAVPEPGRTITLTQLQNELLGDGDLFLDFHLGPNRSILFAVTRDEARCIRLPSATTLEPRLRIYKEILTSGMESGGERSRLPEVARDAVAREVSSLLFGGIEDLLGVSRRVLLSPDGALNLLPLSDLPGRDGALLIEGREWIRVPSAEVLRRIAERPATGLANREIRTLALVGAGRLPGAEREVAELHRGFRGVRTELDASGLSSSEVLHFASHLEVDDQHPWQSSLRLDAGDSTLALDAGTLARMKLPARLAVLSGCSSAGGRIVSGEGVLGISSALLSAGVPSVVATLWPVDDGVTAGFMREFYRRLSEGAPAARALEAAQAELRSRPATREPRHWAGFVLIGDGDVRVPLHRRNAASRPVGLGLVAAGALLALASLRARPRRPR